MTCISMASRSYPLITYCTADHFLTPPKLIRVPPLGKLVNFGLFSVKLLDGKKVCGYVEAALGCGFVLCAVVSEGEVLALVALITCWLLVGNMQDWWWVCPWCSISYACSIHGFVGRRSCGHVNIKPSYINPASTATLLLCLHACSDCFHNELLSVVP